MPTISSTAMGLAPIDWARYATATASSSAYQQSGYKAIDGIVGGYTTSGGDPYSEWSTASGKVGSTLTLSWASPVTLQNLQIFDRPNLNDWCTGATVKFSDGSAVVVPSLNNNGAATNLNLNQSITTTSLIFTVTSVGASTSSVGLSELKAFTLPYEIVLATFGPELTSVSFIVIVSDTLGELQPPGLVVLELKSEQRRLQRIFFISELVNTIKHKHKSIFSAKQLILNTPFIIFVRFMCSVHYLVLRATLVVADCFRFEHAAVQQSAIEFIICCQLIIYHRFLLGSPILLLIVLEHDQLLREHPELFSDGTIITVGSLPNNGAPLAVTFPQVTTTSLLFTCTAVSSSTSNVGLSEIQVFGLFGSATANGLNPINLARYSIATASSSSQYQGANKAIDGQLGGYSNGDYTMEWASAGEKAGAWLLLTFTAPVIITSVKLMDRPNSNDRVLGGVLKTSTGATVTVGNLVNNGGATTVSVPSLRTTTLLFTVTSVSSTTSSVGLSELQVFGSFA
ncbi:hypothetical protein RQP46_008311 [Phenoliferia psychrophenolica]